MSSSVIPAKAGIHVRRCRQINLKTPWIPAFAGMTNSRDMCFPDLDTPGQAQFLAHSPLYNKGEFYGKRKKPIV